MTTSAKYPFLFVTSTSTAGNVSFYLGYFKYFRDKHYELLASSSFRRVIRGVEKQETDGTALEEFVGLRPKMYSFLVDDSSEHKQTKDVNKKVLLKE